ncbi:hypothetical protein HYC85_018743 [Camellia sinensis]|uniref:Uncharacterized protein n=1 Tax=Camellia sinensis TaxID=4442 RepID=A0A7J7GYX4_CAMSI|nr:hypothetical protein HYC85_018743 [Camellia sinensis]
MLDQGCDPDLVTCNIFLKALKEKLNPPQDGSLFLDELVLRLYKRQRIVAASKIVGVMLQKLFPLKASTWERGCLDLPQVREPLHGLTIKGCLCAKTDFGSCIYSP